MQPLLQPQALQYLQPIGALSAPPGAAPSPAAADQASRAWHPRVKMLNPTL